MFDEMSSSCYSKNAQLRQIQDNNIIEYNLTYHNKLPTFFRKGVKSCIDFVISNCPTKVSNVRTHYDDDIYQYEDIDYNNMLSDHIMVSGVYNNKKIAKGSQFRITRDAKLLTKHNLNEYFSCNEYLNMIFQQTDPDIIAKILTRELTVIIESITPSKRIQCSNKYAPWIDSNFIKQAKIRDNLHTVAKNSDSEEDWRIFR